MLERTVLPLNDGWQFRTGFSDRDLSGEASEGFEAVCLPHTITPTRYNYIDETAWQTRCCYRRVLTPDPALKNHRIFADFEGVMVTAVVYCNGVQVCEHKGGFTPFSAELTGLLRFDGTDLLVVQVDGTEQPEVPPFGYVVDYLCFGGIYREVSLRAVPPAHIVHVQAIAQNVLADKKALQLNLELEGCESDAVLQAALLNGTRQLAAAQLPVSAGSRRAQLLLSGLENLRLWCPEDPALYQVELTLTTGSSRDRVVERTGFRTVEFTEDGLFLNGKPFAIRGLNRHQQYPYAGYAMPWRAQYLDAEILKNQLHVNTVRTSHYPQSRHFLDRCDELGLLVLEELPGWQYIGDQAWQDLACQALEAMIRRDCNRPSIFLWGVRINESPDNHDFYLRTNRLAHQLDPTRPTGGIRCIENSELLEDVYTYNDFTHSGGEAVLMRQTEVTGLKHNVPYLVTENNGHMFPTKRFDCEERKIEHALRHARVINAAQADPKIGGMLGWCAFDYNTHKDFGSGDKICYHGVMDMFRIPKFAAAVYASQTGLSCPVLEPATHWTLGDKCEGTVIPITVFTNCDCVQLIANGVDMGMHFPDRENFPALEHPPVVIRSMNMAWGRDWIDARFVGYANGSPVIERNYCANPLPTRLELCADCDRLCAGDWDTTRVICRLVDQCGNPLPYAFEPLQLAVEGPGSLIGPSLISLIGGQTGFWVRTQGAPGRIRLTARCAGLTATAGLSVE